jgi:hypothetical protein
MNPMENISFKKAPALPRFWSILFEKMGCICFHFLGWKITNGSKILIYRREAQMTLQYLFHNDFYLEKVFNNFDESDERHFF